jgi:hypothetical protein
VRCSLYAQAVSNIPEGGSPPSTCPPYGARLIAGFSGRLRQVVLMHRSHFDCGGCVVAQWLHSSVMSSCPQAPLTSQRLSFLVTGKTVEDCRAAGERNAWPARCDDFMGDAGDRDSRVLNGLQARGREQAEMLAAGVAQAGAPTSGRSFCCFPSVRRCTTAPTTGATPVSSTSVSSCVDACT